MERKTTLALLAAAAVLVAVGEVLESREIEISAPSGPVIERKAIVSRVVDGDTILLEGGERVRLAGVNTPELDTPEGQDVMDFMNDLCPPGTEIGLNVDDLEPRGYHGRTLAVVYLREGDSWTNLNAMLLEDGLAEILFIPPSEFNPYGWTG